MHRNVKLCLLLTHLTTVVTCLQAVVPNHNISIEKDDYESIFSILSPHSLIETYLESDFEENDSVSIDDRCARDLVTLHRAFNARDKWARLMMDASSKVPSGILNSNVVEMGVFDECLRVKEKLSDIEIQGRYCLYSINIPGLNLHDIIYPTMSICVPDSCDVQDISYLINETIRTNDVLKNNAIRSSTIHCTQPELPFWDIEMTIFVFASLIYIGFLIFCTFCDIYDKTKHPVLKFCAKLSVKKHAAAIVNLKAKDGAFNFIDGMRVLSSIWIIGCHELLAYTFSMIHNFHDINSFVNSWIAIIFVTGSMTVDTFFIIAAFLMTHQFLQQRSKQEKFDCLRHYLRRYFRITPVVVVVLAVAIIVAPKLGSGPRWDLLINTLSSESCRAKWWSLSLFIQNFVERDSMCLGHLWYLSVEMQFFWISPFILYLLYRKPKVGFFIISVLMIIWIVVSTYIVGINRLPVLSFAHNLSISTALDNFSVFYIMPYNRIGPWLFGICLGYEIFNHKDRKPGMFTVIGGWSLFTLCIVYCALSCKSILKPDYEYDWITESLYFPLTRISWSIAICWLIFACIHNCAGFISSILSTKYFLPFSRLSFCIYLIHLGIQAVNKALARTPTYVTVYSIFQSYVFTCALSIFLAFFMSVLVELPMVEVSNEILKKKDEPKRNEKEIENEENEDKDDCEEKDKFDNRFDGEIKKSIKLNPKF